MTAALNRTVPFLLNELVDPRMMLDEFEFPAKSLQSDNPVVQRIRRSLSLSQFEDTIDVESAIAIASEQYVAGTEFVYCHPIWEDIRKGSEAAVHSYLLETRHYLAAASSRMAPGIHGGLGLDPLTLLLSRHLIEEYDHAKFFEEALRIIGCPIDQVRRARPIPSTVEWVHFTRAVANRDSLAAALCSGFMEFSSRESEAVSEWHLSLVKQGILSEEANAAIFQHVETDNQFGHDKNWEHALLHESPIPINRYVEALNDVSNLCEMIYRWLSAVRNGLSSLVVAAMSTGTVPTINQERKNFQTGIFNGTPVWPSSVLRHVNRGDSAATKMGLTAIGVAYSHGVQNLQKGSSDFEDAVIFLSEQFVPPSVTSPLDSKTLYKLACSWLRSIDGHELWDTMVESGSFSLIQGFMLENYHYLSSATRHVSSAISSCPDGHIQFELIDHLADELEHCRLLQESLEQAAEIDRVESCRPLPTTIAFVDYLRDLATTDWRGYLIASAFLQGSLAEGRPTGRHLRFYDEVIKKNPDASFLLSPLRHHDEIDEKLGHDCRAERRLEALVSRHQIPEESLERAAIVPLLAWGFFDGILQHYQHGAASVLQRMGWTAR